jgi:RNA polymerase primary sigma factor
MPPAARFRTSAIERLLEQLQYAPMDTRRRLMDAAEALLADIQHEQAYPEDFVVFRITGFRPDLEEEPALLIGEALLADLPTFIQRLSQTLSLPLAAYDRQALRPADVAAQLKVSAKTVQRYRREGLVAHYVKGENNRARLVIFTDALQRFLDLHQRKVTRAGRFTRMDQAVREAIVREAKSLHAREGVTLNQAARRLADKHDRALETVRQVLQQADRDSDEPIFRERGPLTEREQRMILRAWERGSAVNAMAQRLGRTRTAVLRALHNQRAARIRTLHISYINLPTLELPEAEVVILASPAVRQALDTPSLPDDAMTLLEQCAATMREAHSGEDEAAEASLVAAQNYLKHRVQRTLANLAAFPRSADIDQVETSLRWAGMIKRKLVMLVLPVLVQRIEQNMHGRLIDQPAHGIIQLLQRAVQVGGEVVEHLDPSRGQHLAGVGRIAMDRSLATQPIDTATGRAAARHAVGAVSVGGLLDSLTPWTDMLSLRRDLRAYLETINVEHAQLVRDHHGLDGRYPLTVAELAQDRGVTTTAISRMLQSAIRALRTSVRQAT